MKLNWLKSEKLDNNVSYPTIDTEMGQKGKQIGTSEAISDLKGMSVAYDIIWIMERAI